MLLQNAVFSPLNCLPLGLGHRLHSSPAPSARCRSALPAPPKHHPNGPPNKALDQKLCFSSRPFVLCGLPFRPLPKTQLLYERRNGHFVLQIAGHPDYGVPFGQERLIPIFLATLAIQQKTPTIRFKTAAEMLDIFGMSKGVENIEG